EGNLFTADAVGVEIVTLTPADQVGGIDLGGGSQGSRGGNDFRSFTAPATGTAAAIVLDTVAPLAPAQTVSAKANLFAVANPQTVVSVSSSSVGTSVDTSGNLTGNAAFVQTLYEQFLHRVG